MAGLGSEKTLQDIETKLGEIDTVLDNIHTLIEDYLGMTARTFSAPAGATATDGATNEVLAANASRKFAIIDIENPTDDVFVGIGAAAAAQKGMRLKTTTGTQRILVGAVPTSLHGAGDVQNVQLPLTTQAINIWPDGSGVNTKWHAMEAT